MRNLKLSSDVLASLCQGIGRELGTDALYGVLIGINTAFFVLVGAIGAVVSGGTLGSRVGAVVGCVRS